MKMWMKWSLICVFLLSAILITLNTDLLTQLNTKDTDEISKMIGDNIPYILFITFIIMLIHNAFPIIPLLLVITVNNALLGFIWGFVWGICISVVCAVIVFLSVRFGFQSLITQRMNESIKKRIESRGFFYVLTSRIFPFAPTSIINSMAAVSNIKLSVYTISTLIGNVIIFLIYTVMHAGLVSQSQFINEYVIAGAVVVGILISYFIKKSKKRKTQEYLEG